MCGFSKVLVCVCLGFVMYGFVYVLVCNAWVCVCVVFVLCGCVCVGFVMCGCVYVLVL